MPLSWNQIHTNESNAAIERMKDGKRRVDSLAAMLFLLSEQKHNAVTLLDRDPPISSTEKVRLDKSLTKINVHIHKLTVQSAHWRR